MSCKWRLLIYLNWISISVIFSCKTFSFLSLFLFLMFLRILLPKPWTSTCLRIQFLPLYLVLQYIFIRSSDWFWYVLPRSHYSKHPCLEMQYIFSFIWIEFLFLYFILQDIFIHSFEISISETTDDFTSLT